MKLRHRTPIVLSSCKRNGNVYLRYLIACGVSTHYILIALFGRKNVHNNTLELLERLKVN